MSADVPTLDVEVDKVDYKDKVYELLAKIRPGWKQGDIEFEVIAQGIVNLMVVCYVSDDKVDAVVVRVFGNLIASVVKREQEIKANKLLSKLGLGAPLLAIFKNGICSGYIKGRPTTWADVGMFRDIDLAKKVAKTLAAFHCKTTSDLAKEWGIGKGSDFMELAGQTLQGWPIPFQDKAVEEWFYKQLPPAETLRAEFEISMTVVKEGREKFPEVLCHGDLNPTNFMIEDATGDVKFVDYECVGFNIPVGDLAIYFTLSSANPMAQTESPHSPEYTRDFIRTYLEEINRRDGVSGDVTDQEVERYSKMAEKLTIAMDYMGLLLAPGYYATNPNLSVEGMDFKTMLQPMLGKWDSYLKKKEKMLSIVID